MEHAVGRYGAGEFELIPALAVAKPIGDPVPRLNQLIDLFEQSEVAVGYLVPVGDDRLARRVGESDVDLAVLDFEHEGFDFPALGVSMQWLISRRRIIHSGMAIAGPTPLVRIPASGFERNDWIIKQALDYGPFGLVVPHLACAADVRHLVASMRYPQQPDSPAPEPQGHRGFWPGLAWRYWGANSFEDFYPRADLWPLNPAGELLLMGIVEDVEGWENIEEIVREPGLGAIWFGPGDGSVSIGNIKRDWEHPTLARYRDRVLQVCRDAGVVVGTSARGSEQISRLIDQGFQFINASGSSPEEFAVEVRRIAGRATTSWGAGRLGAPDEGCRVLEQG